MSQRYVKFLKISPKKYETIPRKDEDTLYFVFDEDSHISKLYLGSKMISDEDISDITLSNIDEILLNENIVHNSFLVYDDKQKKWVNKTLSEAVDIFIAAGPESTGVAGLVPAPPKGDDGMSFLRSDQTWVKIPESNINKDELVDIINQIFLEGKW